MMNRLFFLLLLILTGVPAQLQAENITAPLALPGQPQMPPTSARPVSEEMEIAAPVPLLERNSVLRPAVGAGLLLIGGGLLFFFLWKKRQKPQMALQPHETAYLLAQAQKQLEEDNCAAFADLLAQTLRHYLEERFNLAASRQTARELISGIAAGGEDAQEQALLQTYVEQLQTWLELCDAVKFAGASLSRERMAELTAHLRAFIEMTKKEAAKK
ncbi:hypothetical protein [Candidatus Electronema sp. PJ]|uniref:hypothetical protein n=1 Tax=Candidatus Electronema sp. PJ TaxID=3401572 RepID=UPI003AA861AF